MIDDISNRDLKEFLKESNDNTKSWMESNNNNMKTFFNQINTNVKSLNDNQIYHNKDSAELKAQLVIIMKFMKWLGIVAVVLLLLLIGKEFLLKELLGLVI